MPKIVKLNYDRKVRYLYDKDTEECNRLAEQVMDHYGKFLETPHGWDMDSIAGYEKVLRNCGLSVNEFLAKTFTIKTKPKKKSPTKKKPVVKKTEPKVRKSADTPKSKPRKSVVVKEDDPKKKPIKRKTFGATTKKKPTVTKKKTPVKKKTPIKKKPAKKVA